VHADLEEIPINAPSVQGDFRIFELEVGMRQAATLSTADILGEWILYRQRAVTTKQTIEGSEVEQLLRFKFSSDRVIFSDSTFTAEVLLNTENPGEVGNSFGSTWSLDGTRLLITAPGQGVLAQDTISAGKDSAILIRRESEPFPQGNLFEDEFGVWVKIAPSLVSADIVGTWRNVYMETIFDDDSSDDSIDYVDFNYGIEEFRLFADGTGLSRVLDGTSEAAGTTEAFVWSIANDKELILTGAEGSRAVQLSAGKDFGVLLQVHDKPGAGLDEYDYAMFIKQSDQPAVGFESNLPSIDVGSGLSIAPEISLQSISGVYYQLQRKTDLAQTEWSNLGSPVLGTGAPITLEDLSPPDDVSFYRVTVVPAP